MTRRRIVRLAIVLPLVGAALAYAVATASADVTIGVAPSLVEIEATPGAQGGQTLVVSNDGGEAFQVTASVQPYRDATGDHSAVDWLSMDPSSFVLAPGAQQAVRVRVVVPPGLPSGGRYAAASFQTEAKQLGASGAGVAGRVLVPFLIVVEGSGGLVRRAVIDRLLPVLETDGQIGFRAQLANRGNLHVVPHGQVEVKSAASATVGGLELPETTAILPGSEQLLATRGTLPLLSGGAYTARATVQYGTGTAAGEAAFRAQAAAEVTSLEATENRDKGPTLALGLRNTGDLALTPRVQFALRSKDGTEVGTAAGPLRNLIWPGETAMVKTQFPGRLNSGEYVLAVRAEYPGAPPIHREATFRIGVPPPPPNRAWATAPARGPQLAPTFFEIDSKPAQTVGLIVSLLVIAFVVSRTFGPFRRRLQRAALALLGNE